MSRIEMVTSNIIINNNAIHTTRKEHSIDTKRRKARCFIPTCNCECYDGDGSVRVTTPAHPRGVTLCRLHGEDFYRHLASYSSENKEYIGTLTDKRISQSFEIESNNNTAISSAVMYGDFNAYATSDGSLGYKGIEWKTAIYRSLCGATKLFGAIEDMNNKGYFNTLDEKCGAHIHTGIIDASDNNVYDWSTIFSCIDEYYQVFRLLYEYLDKMPNEKMIEYFGRGFIDYARTLRWAGEYDGVNRYVLPLHDGHGRKLSYDTKYLNGDDNLYGTGSCDCTQHYLLFNLQHSYSLEFRLPKFVNATQYRRCALAMQDVVLYIEKYYIKEHNSVNSIKCACALQKVFKKYFPY